MIFKDNNNEGILKFYSLAVDNVDYMYRSGILVGKQNKIKKKTK